MCCFQLELPTSPASEIISRTRATGILPVYSETIGFTDEEHAELSRAFVDGMRNAAASVAERERAIFARRGWAFQWFLDWKPKTKAEESRAEAIEDALHVIETSYQPILDRGLDHAEDMGILQMKRWGDSEGVGVKREAYGSTILVSIYCSTGPSNFDPLSGTVEFEKGARSHVFHLVYRELPSMERLCGDLVAHPLITDPKNRACHGMNGTWMSEGWTGAHGTRPWLHRPWDTLPGVSDALTATP